MIFLKIPNKKTLLVLSAVILVFTLIFTPNTTAATKDNSLGLIINGKYMVLEQKPYISNGTTMVPFRPVLEELGFSVKYNSKLKEITAEGNTPTVLDPKRTSSVKLTVGSTVAYINNKKETLRVAPLVKNGTTYVPLVFLSNAAGRNIEYFKDYDIVQVGAQIKLNPFSNITWNMKAKDIKNTENREMLTDITDHVASGMYAMEYSEETIRTVPDATLTYYFETKSGPVVEFDYSFDSTDFYENYYAFIYSTTLLDESFGEFKGSSLVWDAPQSTQDAYWNVYKNDFEEMIRAAMRTDELVLIQTYEDNFTVVNAIFFNYGTASSPLFGTVINFAPKLK